MVVHVCIVVIVVVVTVVVVVVVVKYGMPEKILKVTATAFGS